MIALATSLDVKIQDRGTALAQLARLMQRIQLIDRVEVASDDGDVARFYTHEPDRLESFLRRNGYQVIPH